MRSRFSAFAYANAGYLLTSWHPTTRPKTIELDNERRWRFLEILDTEHGGLFDEDGIVEFRAHYRDTDGNRGVLHERSNFTKEAGRWYYLGGVFAD